jgi:hypothetical protein
MPLLPYFLDNDFSGAGFNWNTFPTWNSGMVEAIKAFSAQYPDVPFWHQGPDVPDYLPPKLTTLIAQPGADDTEHQLLIPAEIWNDLQNTWTQWAGFAHFEVQQRVDPIEGLCLQEQEKQGRFKLSYYADAGRLQELARRIAVVCGGGSGIPIVGSE